MTTHTIDAKDKKLGRVASTAATILMGKDTSTYKRNAAPEVKVMIINTSKAELSEKKRANKIYRNYSGFPGGLRSLSMQQVIEKKGKGYSELFRDAVYGMLPSNKLRAQMMKNLVITE